MSWGPRRGMSDMHRSSRWPRRRRSDSRSSARDIRRTLETSPSTTLIAVPAGSGRLSDGLIIEASVVARLLGLRLLALDASVVVSPAEMRGRPPASAAPRTRPGAIGAGLATAERRIAEGAASLAAARAGG
jgi:hypothetical protein